MDEEGREAGAKRLLVLYPNISLPRFACNPLLTASLLTPLFASPIAAMGEDFADSVSIRDDTFKEMKKILSTCNYTQKHTDLCLGDLASQIEIACLEQGRVLRKARDQYAGVFQDVSRLHSDGLWQLEVAVRTVKELRDNLEEMKGKKRQFEDDMRIEVEKRFIEAQKMVDTANQEKREEVKKYEEKINSINKSLYTLQNVIRNMSQDTAEVRGGDMSAQVLKLRKVNEEQDFQLKELMPLKSENKTLTVKLMLRENELKGVKEDNKSLQNELERKDKLLALLMNQKKGVLTEEEFKLLKGEEDRAEKGNSDGEEEEEEEEEKKDLPPTSVICALCTRRLDAVINIKDKLVVGPPKLPAEAFRLMLPKLNVVVDEEEDESEAAFEEKKDNFYGTEEKKEEGGGAVSGGDEANKGENEEESDYGGKSQDSEVSDSDSDSDSEDEQLPIVTNESTMKITRMLKSKMTPAIIRQRGMDELWIMRVMRGIINSKLVEDNMLFSGSYTLQSGLGCRRTRFPEFVYSWFTPPQEHIYEVCSQVRNCSKSVSHSSKTYRKAVQNDVEAKAKLMAEADEQRWALYYGVKGLAHRTPAVPEATIFWNLLDETHQEDYLSFYCYCLQAVRFIGGASLSKQYGATLLPTPPPNHYGFVHRTEGEGKEKYPQEPGEEDNVLGPLPRTLWVSEDDAVKAVNLVTTKAVQEDKDVIMRALKAVMITAQGRMPNIFTNKTKCVDLHMLLNLLMHTYRSEQANRTSALRLMFEAAAAGRTTPQALMYAMERGYGRKGKRGPVEDEEKVLHMTPPCLDYLSFKSVLTCLAPKVSTNEISQIFRETWYAHGEKVNFENFIKTADVNQFFSRSAEFPSYLLASTANNERYSTGMRHRVGALVHLNNHTMQAKFNEIEARLPLMARAMMQGARREVDETIEFCSTAGCVDGMAPLSAYRRLLHACLQIRIYEHDCGGGFAGVEKEGVVAGYIQEEMESLGKVLRDFDPCPMMGKLETFKRSYSVNRVVETWRQRLAMSHGPPLGMIRLMRCGYLGGRGGIRSRRIYKSLGFLLQTISEIFTYKIGLDMAKKRKGEQATDLNMACHSFFVCKLGVVSVAERYLHDFFYTIRTCSSYVARVKAFTALVGMKLDSSSQAQETKQEFAKAKRRKGKKSKKGAEEKEELDEEEEEERKEEEFRKSITLERLLKLKEASVFYLHLLNLVHSVKRETRDCMEKRKCLLKEALRIVGKRRMRGVQEKGRKKTVMGWDSKEVEGIVGEGDEVRGVKLNVTKIPLLFPDALEEEGGGKKGTAFKWMEPIEVLIACAEIAFDEVRSFDAKEDFEVDKMRAEMFKHIHESAGEGGKEGEVDEWLWQC